ncbi:MAG: hypothetical protein N3A61_01960, partial [Ignavibacteria bacterium]|nr:hypothetical protein [Ignavibacteria bacterium]
MKKYLSTFLILFLSTVVFSQVEYTTRLWDKLNKASSDDYIRVLCLLRDRVDIASLDKKLYAQNASIQKRAYEVITQLMSKAESTQKDLINFIKQKQSSNSVRTYQSFWVTNLIMVEAKKSVINELLKNNQIEFMDIDAELTLDPYIDEGPAKMNITGSEVGLRVVGADKLWKLGITGFGRLVMDMDTGVDPNHPAFASRWRGLRTPLSLSLIHIS